MKKIVLLLPSLIEGSGGHRTLINHARALQQAGYDVQLALEEMPLFRRDARAHIRRLFGVDFSSISIGWDILPPADMVIASSWPSAYVAARSAAALRLYFVQDNEASFIGKGSLQFAAEYSYRLGLHAVSIGRWLPSMLQQSSAAGVQYFDFGADLQCYHPDAQTRREPQSIAFIYQPDKPRRCAELGLQALSVLQQQRPEVRIKLYGSRYPAWRGLDCQHLGLLPPSGCADLYRQASVGLCLSASNPSRIPFEMMACGLPVVEIHGDNTRYDLPDDGCLLCEPTPGALAAGLARLLDDQALARQMGDAGAAFMATRPLEHECQQFVGWVDYLFAHGRLPAASLAPLYQRPPVTGSVPVLPAAPASALARKRRQLFRQIKQGGKLMLDWLEH